MLESKRLNEPLPYTILRGDKRRVKEIEFKYCTQCFSETSSIPEVSRVLSNTLNLQLSQKFIISCVHLSHYVVVKSFNSRGQRNSIEGTYLALWAVQFDPWCHK